MDNFVLKTLSHTGIFSMFALDINVLYKFRFFENNTSKPMISYHTRRVSVWAVILIFTAFPVIMQAQSKADKLLNKADEYFNSNNTVDAEILYKQVLSEDPNNYRAAYQLGRVNSFVNDYQEALRWYRKASEIDPNRNDTVYLQIGLAYKRLNNYRQAIAYFEEFKTRHQTQDEYFERAELEIQGCELAQNSMAALPDFRVKPVSFNSTSSDRYPSFLDQRQEDKFLTFASYRPLPRKKAKRDPVTGEAKDSDLYYVIRENDSIFGEISRFPASSLFSTRINTKRNDGPASITGDGLIMYFSICNSKKNKNGCSIFETRYNPVKKEWGKPVFLEDISGQEEVIVNSRGKTKKLPTDDREPFISRDGRTLYFTSNRGGGEGGFDIWFSRKMGSGWSPPQNLGPTINTPFNESSAYINEAGDRLYFASEGLAGFGGLDLYYAEGTVGNFSDPVNMGYPINTSYNDYGGMWIDNDSTVYFTSDRPGSMGRDDIFWARRIYREPPPVEIAVKGLVRDKETLQPISFATVILFEQPETGALVVLDTFETDQSARYEFPLEKDKSYMLLGNAPEYLAGEEYVNTLGMEAGYNEIVKNIDIELERIDIGKRIVLDNIYYDFDEYYLRPDALDELERLVELLNQNPNIMIELGSHTDSNGTDAYNYTLSDNRAKAVISYLVDNGINPARLTWKGYGESQLWFYPEMSDADEQANRRTEFRIMSIEFIP